jgi:hypothetical protein
VEMIRVRERLAGAEESTAEQMTQDVFNEYPVHIAT